MLYKLLATLPFPLFVSLRHDQALEHFLQAVGKNPLEKSYNFRGDQQLSLGECRSSEQPVVYHLFGSVSDPKSMALTQRDLFELLAAISSGTPGLPADLTNYFRERNFLFIGCGLHSYYLQVLLHFLGLSRSEQRSFAAEPTNSESVWFYRVEYRTLKLLNIDATHFVSELAELWHNRSVSETAAVAALAPRELHSDRPKVFISHLPEDKTAAEKSRKEFEGE